VESGSRSRPETSFRFPSRRQPDLSHGTQECGNAEETPRPFRRPGARGDLRGARDRNRPRAIAHGTLGLAPPTLPQSRKRGSPARAELSRADNRSDRRGTVGLATHKAGRDSVARVAHSVHQPQAVLGDGPPVGVGPLLWHNPSQAVFVREVCNRGIPTTACQTLPEQKVERRPFRCLTLEVTAIRKGHPTVRTWRSRDRVEIIHLASIGVAGRFRNDRTPTATQVAPKPSTRSTKSSRQDLQDVMSGVARPPLLC